MRRRNDKVVAIAESIVAGKPENTAENQQLSANYPKLLIELINLKGRHVELISKLDEEFKDKPVERLKAEIDLDNAYKNNLFEAKTYHKRRTVQFENGTEVTYNGKKYFVSENAKVPDGRVLYHLKDEKGNPFQIKKVDTFVEYFDLTPEDKKEEINGSAGSPGGTPHGEGA